MTAHAQWVFDQQEGSNRFLLFVFFSTLASYNFHWYLTPETRTEPERSSWSHDHKPLHLMLTVIGSVAAAILSLSFLPHFLALGVAILLTFLYSAPKIPHRHFSLLSRIAVGKTIYLAFVWTYVTAVLPLIFSGKGLTNADLLFCVSRYFFIYAICIPFDYRDRENDRLDGIRSLITYLSPRGIDRLFYFSLFLSFAALVSYHYLTGWGPEFLILAIPMPILLLLYPVTKRDFSDYLYYLVLDGLMALPSLGVWGYYLLTR